MPDVAIMGFGTVGQGVCEVIRMNGDLIAQRTGTDGLNIRHILDLRSFPGHPLADMVTHSFEDILGDDRVTVVAETMGGLHPAYEYTLALLNAGKSVVTSNKAVVERYGAEFAAAAKRSGAGYLYEASAGGGIPVIHPLFNCFGANDILRVSGILNGTTNFILTKMRREGEPFWKALSDAQANGYAEADPSADICGTDAARKICILAGIAFDTRIPLESLSVIEGIENIRISDFDRAAEYGCTIRLIGLAEKCGDRAKVLVAPYLVDSHSVLGVTDGVFNAVSVFGNAVGEISLYGQGAGSLPTASAVVANMMEAVKYPAVTIIREKCPENYVLSEGENQDPLLAIDGDKTEIIEKAPFSEQKKALAGRRFYRILR